MPLRSQRIAFGSRLRALRMDRGWSQEEFAHRADLDRTYVSGVERGVRNPTLDVITKFAETLSVEIADLFPRADQRRSALGSSDQRAGDSRQA